MQKYEIKEIILSAIKTDYVIWNQHALERMKDSVKYPFSHYPDLSGKQCHVLAHL